MNRILQDARFYGILDLGYTRPDDLVPVAREMLKGGIDVIQLRAKLCEPDDITSWARQLLPLCRDAGVPLVINDYPEIASEVEADGVHVGQDDLSMDEVRGIVGADMLVGRSTHSVAQAAGAAADDRTDYIGFGPLFATPTKPDYTPIGVTEIRTVHLAHPDLPIFCIGGIKRGNLRDVIASGAKRVVIVSGILQAEDIERYVSESKEILCS